MLRRLWWLLAAVILSACSIGGLTDSLDATEVGTDLYVLSCAKGDALVSVGVDRGGKTLWTATLVKPSGLALDHPVSLHDVEMSDVYKKSGTRPDLRKEDLVYYSTSLKNSLNVVVDQRPVRPLSKLRCEGSGD